MIETIATAGLIGAISGSLVGIFIIAWEISDRFIKKTSISLEDEIKIKREVLYALLNGHITKEEAKGKLEEAGIYLEKEK